MSETVTKLHIISGEFDNGEYIIPLYQRAFAWEDKHLIQFIEDIHDVADDANYYIGTLIVSKREEKYEIIDGQQRLTSLFLLLNCLEKDEQNDKQNDKQNVKPSLTFACREKSNYTLENIKELLAENNSNLDMDKIEASIQRGAKIISDELARRDAVKETFEKNLKKVILYRIEVPEHTDLNRYFEIMNTRGEQLEQHDIVKATLMSSLSDKEQSLFAKIWDACSDMTGYVQMHFAKDVREAIFGGDWNDMPSDSWSDFEKVMQTNTSETNTGETIKDIIEKENDEGHIDDDGDDDRVRFESIIEFPYFLLQTLKAFVDLQKIKVVRPNEKDAYVVPLDDKKLIDAFDQVFGHGVTADGKLADDKAEFVRGFILCLLRTRYIFDKYIIKREYANDSTDGKWSLKSLNVSSEQKKKNPYYSNTRFTKSEERNSTEDGMNKKNLMIQSALRVSYTSPSAMHWITNLLIWLMKNNCEDNANDNIAKFHVEAEKVAIESVKKFLDDKNNDRKYEMGVKTPHIVFNYLDYLLWRNEREKYKDFAFEFRNSVEHWYPRNPSEGTFEEWEDGVDRFGNLCIVQRNVNSKFSNLSPEAKKSTFEGMINKGSIKLRDMSKLTEKDHYKSASLNWKKTKCKEHEEKMIKLLKEACENQ